MIRLLLFFVFLGALAYGGLYLVQHPGHVSLDWFGYQIETSAALLVIAIAIAAVIAWIIFRVVVGLPSFMAYSARQRRREKGYAALSRGLIAVGAGDARGAGRAAAQANRRLRDDPLALMLRAQAAHLNGDAEGAMRAFQALAQREDTRVFGLRGLHAEASRRGDDEAASHFAAAAHKAAPLPWSAQAMLEQRAHAGAWEAALATVESSISSRLVDKETGNRQRAVLETAIAYDKQGTAPDEALTLASAALKRAPDLAPAAVLAARLYSRRGDIRKASKLVEKVWPHCPHPDVAQAYLDVRPGDSTADRLSRAKTLMGLASFDPVSRMTVARAALANKDFTAARSAMEPLVAEGKHPTIGMCRLMAEIDEAEHGDIGLWREWLARASRASLDPAWVADGIVYDHWSPVSPTTGRLDAFRWQVPAERLGPAMEAMPAPPSKALPPSREPTSPSESVPMLRHADPPRPAEPDIGAPAAAELAVAESPTDAAEQLPSGPVLASPTVAKDEPTTTVVSGAELGPAESSTAVGREAHERSTQEPSPRGSVAREPSTRVLSSQEAPVQEASAPEPQTLGGSLDGAHQEVGETDEPHGAAPLPKTDQPRRSIAYTSG